MNFTHKDKTGHICIEVFFEIKDGGSLEKHNVCFFVNTELGMLYEFSNSLIQFNHAKLGAVVSLHL